MWQNEYKIKVNNKRNFKEFAVIIIVELVSTP